MKFQFTSTPKVFTNENGQSIEYTQRCIVIDNIEYKIPKTSGQVFDLQFKDLVNQEAIEVDL